MTLGALEILAAMRETYARCVSYRDAGHVVSAVDSQDGHTTYHGKFKTEFVREIGWFLFDFLSSDGEAFTIRAERGRVLEANYPGATSDPSIGFAISGLTGITLGSAHVVPRLLMAEVGGRAVSDAATPQLLGSEVVFGERCTVIDLGAALSSQICIGEQTNRLRREILLMGSSRPLQEHFRTRNLRIPPDFGSAQILTYEAVEMVEPP